MSLNKVMLIGYLGQDPLVKYLESNRVVAQFSLATHENFTDKNGETRVETEWHQVVVWDALAKWVDQYKLKSILIKGCMVYVEGKIKTENYRDKNGIEQKRKVIKANQVQLLGNSKHVENKPDTTLMSN